VAILDADKEGFLRSTRSLIQTIGRAARNVTGKVIMYADRITDSMKQAIDETERRRAAQHAYNQEHGIVPRSTRRELNPIENEKRQAERARRVPVSEKAADAPVGIAPIDDADLTPAELTERIQQLRAEMLALAKELRYEDAARIRDRIRVLE